MECGAQVCNTHWRLMGPHYRPRIVRLHILHRTSRTACFKLCALHTGVWWGHTELINPQLTSSHLPPIVSRIISWGTLSSGRTLVGHCCHETIGTLLEYYRHKIVSDTILSRIILSGTLSSGRTLLSWNYWDTFNICTIDTKKIQTQFCPASYHGGHCCLVGH